MNCLINYANKIYQNSQKVNSQTGLEVGGFDRVISYSYKDIDADFYQKNKRIFNQRRGDGCWLWKFYFIKKSLMLLNEGDFLFYCDSGATFIAPINQLINACVKADQDVIPFELVLQEKYWTKRDAFILMDCDRPECTETKQILGSFSLWRKSLFSMQFIEACLEYGQDARIITDMDNQCGFPDYEGFAAHRHDQSIFSLMTKKYKLIPFRDPSQFGNGREADYANSEYGQILIHTRRKNRLRYLMHHIGWRQ